MGKYTRKAKTSRDVAVTDLSLGVRTRAKTLALRLQARPPAPLCAASQPDSPCGYLQLRSRRLVKPPLVVHYLNPQKQSSSKVSKAGLRARPGRVDSGSVGSGQEKEVNRENEVEVIKEKNSKGEDANDLGTEVSFGDNVLDIEDRERTTRESTPCSLIRDPESVRTPGSTTRPTSSSGTNRRMQNSICRGIPTSVEMDELFARAEGEQQKQFVQKYNFDPINDKPLPGRYEWEKVDP